MAGFKDDKRKKLLAIFRNYAVSIKKLLVSILKKHLGLGGGASPPTPVSAPVGHTVPYSKKKNIIFDIILSIKIGV
ncbi:MAG: hypothetical protein FJ333_03100 [Sphingomonadales bacterium]|nr:hypothetical protein [Sphingomonadales bacterium]